MPSDLFSLAATPLPKATRGTALASPYERYLNWWLHFGVLHANAD